VTRRHAGARYRDALARRDEIDAFLARDGLRYQPLFPVELA